MGMENQEDLPHLSPAKHIWFKIGTLNLNLKNSNSKKPPLSLSNPKIIALRKRLFTNKAKKLRKTERMGENSLCATAQGPCLPALPCLFYSALLLPDYVLPCPYMLALFCLALNPNLLIPEFWISATLWTRSRQLLSVFSSNCVSAWTDHHEQINPLQLIIHLHSTFLITTLVSVTWQQTARKQMTHKTARSRLQLLQPNCMIIISICSSNNRFRIWWLARN